MMTINKTNRWELKTWCYNEYIYSCPCCGHEVGEQNLDEYEYKCPICKTISLPCEDNEIEPEFSTMCELGGDDMDAAYEELKFRILTGY